MLTYSWVRNISSLSRIHVAHSTEPLLERFLILIYREDKNMSRTFFDTVSPCCLLWLCRLSIVEYKNLSTSCSNWQLFCCSVCWWCQGRVPQKSAYEIAVGGNYWRFSIFAGGVSISDLKGTSSSISHPTMGTKTYRFGNISDSATRSTTRRRFFEILFRCG